MASAKEIFLKPISAKESNELVRRTHYSRKVVTNSTMHIGVFMGGKLEGAMQFGPSLDKRKMMGLVEGTGWNDFIELNRMAFGEALPRNSESRALGIAMKMIRKHAPQIKWVISFADAAQCGDGAIYRATGFVLTMIKDSVGNFYLPTPDEIAAHPDFDASDQRWLALKKYATQFRTIHIIFVQAGNRQSKEQLLIKQLFNDKMQGAQNMKGFIKYIGGEPVKGHQLRYIYFIDPSYRERLTVPILPFSEIEKRGARMYKGEAIRESVTRATSIDSDAPSTQDGEGGAVPTVAL